MRNVDRLPSGQRIEPNDPPELQGQEKPAISRRPDPGVGLLLRHPNFVANSAEATLETRSLACEASALTTEPTAQGCIYSSPRNHLRKHV